MPRRKTHLKVGAGFGATGAALAARHETGSALIMEMAGGAIGGAVGGLLPDVLEPAINAWHRSVAHSWSMAGAVTWTLRYIARAQETCRRRSEDHRQTDEQADGGQEWLHRLLQQVWRLISGLIPGLGFGYLSHLVLDSRTPRGLPLVGR